MSNWDAEWEYAEVLKVSAGLPLALGIAGSVRHVDYADSGNRERKIHRSRFGVTGTG